MNLRSEAAIQYARNGTRITMYCVVGGYTSTSVATIRQ